MVMRKTITKARTTMQTEINGTFHSMKNSTLNFRKLTNRTAFSEIYEFKGRFPFDRNKIPASISGNFHGRMVQTFPAWKTTRRTALFAWNFLMISRFKSQTEHWYVDIVTFYTPQQHWPYTKQKSSKTALYRLSQNKGFNESYNGSARVINLCTFPSQPTQNKQVHYGGHYFYISLSSRI